MNIEDKDNHWFVEFNARVLVSKDDERSQFNKAVTALKELDVDPNWDHITEMVLKSLFKRQHEDAIKQMSSGYFEFGAVRRKMSLAPWLFSSQRDQSTHNFRIMFREKSDAMMFKLRFGGNV